jgi:ribA/ribD-fused uncharacterized protein
MHYEGTRFEKVALICKVREPFGSLGNMSQHPIEYAGQTWPTAEALFQALRFAADDPVVEQLRMETNPMRAKWLAKSRAEAFVVQPMTAGDVFNMTDVLREKLKQHADVREVLASTTGHEIIEDCTKRQRGSGLFWGAALRDDGKWYGRNQLGRLWMQLRSEL